MLSKIFQICKDTGRWNPDFAYDTPIELVLVGLDVLIVLAFLMFVCVLLYCIHGYKWRKKRDKFG